MRVRVCPHADRSLLYLLGERGYRVRDFMNVYYRQLEEADSVLPPRPDLNIQVTTSEETEQWFMLEAQGDWAEPDGVAFMTIRCTLKPRAQLFLAWNDRQLVGGGALEVHDNVAELMAASTRPAFRKQGVQTALLRARLAAAVEAGCDLAMVQTKPGAGSQRNVLRAGFQLEYTTVELVSYNL